MTNSFIEMIGYLGSSLVLVSFLMASVAKLRIVNSIGSVIFTIYAFIIHSYPTAIMNICLVLINIYYLVKLSNTSVDYTCIKILMTLLSSTSSITIPRTLPNVSRVLMLTLNRQISAMLSCMKAHPPESFLGKKKQMTM